MKINAIWNKMSPKCSKVKKLHYEKREDVNIKIVVNKQVLGNIILDIHKYRLYMMYRKLISQWCIFLKESICLVSDTLSLEMWQEESCYIYWWLHKSNCGVFFGNYGGMFELTLEMWNAKY